MSRLSDPRQQASVEALTRLTRLAQRRKATRRWLSQGFEGRLDGLAEPALDVAVETGDPIGQILADHVRENASPALAERLMIRCDREDYAASIPLREVALAAVQELAQALRNADGHELDDVRKVGLAGLLNNSSYRLSGLGRLAEALEASREAVSLFRECVRAWPEHLPGLAISLLNLGRVIEASGRPMEALAKTREP
jgi:tetratricopeptide (TPR) repeat protein